MRAMGGTQVNHHCTPGRESASQRRLLSSFKQLEAMEMVRWPTVKDFSGAPVASFVKQCLFRVLPAWPAASMGRLANV